MSEFENNPHENSESEYAYKSVMNGKVKTRLWSIISLALGIASIAFCFIGWLGIVFSVAAAAVAVYSRKDLGYFDKITLTGMISSIFGLVFSVTMIILTSLSIITL